MRRVAAVTLVTLSLVVVQQAGVALPGYGETPQVSTPWPLAGHDTARAAPGRLDAETESAWEAYTGMVAPPRAFRRRRRSRKGYRFPAIQLARKSATCRSSRATRGGCRPSG